VIRYHTSLIVSSYPRVITLTDTYGYLQGDITVLKDLPEFAESSRPTRDNMVRDTDNHRRVISIEV
jgi:hypothetical protein